MKHPDMISHFTRHVVLSEEEIEMIESRICTRPLKRNEFLIRQGENDCPFIFVRSGCLMTYYTDNKQADHVMQFGMPTWWTGDLNSFYHHSPAMYSIKAMEPSEVYIFDRETLEELFEAVPALEKYFRILFQKSLVTHQQRIIRNISMTGEEKYDSFKALYPDLELRVPQKYIASYMGMTPEFLSMLRRRIAGR